MHLSTQTSTLNKVCAQYVVLGGDFHTAAHLQTAGHHPVSPLFWWEGLLAWQVCPLGNSLPTASLHLQIHLHVPTQAVPPCLGAARCHHYLAELYSSFQEKPAPPFQRFPSPPGCGLADLVNEQAKESTGLTLM